MFQSYHRCLNILYKLLNIQTICTLLAGRQFHYLYLVNIVFSFNQKKIFSNLPQISVNLSTIEKRFELSSTKSSFIINAYDISCAVTVMFISHFCKNNKPKWIGIGIIVMGIGALIFTVPHLAET